MESDDDDPRIHSDSSAQDARNEFDEYVLPRRRAAEVAGEPGGTWGLALSGGGIRSATFCFGLIRGLAKNGLLREFDYLSTVSGGGYIGASLGRLYRADTPAKEVEAGVADDGSMWLWWLRNNGRYLTPAGVKDLGFAAASIVRGIIATHLEIGILVLMLSALALLPHMLVSLWPPLQTGGMWSTEFVALLGSVWWWLILLPLFAAIHQLCAYWYTRDKRTPTSVALVAVASLGSALAGIWLWSRGGAKLSIYSAGAQQPSPAAIVSLYALAVLAAAPTTAWLASFWDSIRRRTAAERRLIRTKRLSYCLWALAAFLAIGMLDWATWRITRWFWGSREASASYEWIAAAVAVLLTAGRIALPEIQRRLAAAKKPSVNMEKLLNLIGVVLSLLVAVFWTALLSIALYPYSERTSYALGAAPLQAWPVRVWLVVMALGVVYLLATRRSFDLLNLASLHNFYRARIERAYVSSGNCDGEKARFPVSALRSVSPARTLNVAPLTEAIDGDDIELTEYAPHRFGGPIHLVNCCINQSVDDRTGLYNADRKGVALTLGSLGVETGTEFPQRCGYGTAPGKLSRWIAISGAAASTGMGSRTSPGFASLLFMSGLRLGFWIPSLLGDAAQTRLPKRFRTALLNWAPKPLAIVAESLARFPGLFSSIWYVSDGGHFDNTGIYALLKRKPKVIVAADCGADPKYLFSDLESLVRKAKIDYGAYIEFVDIQKLDPGHVSPELAKVAGTPETIGPDASSQWLVVGRIRYRDGAESTLLVIKPRRLDQMPFDIVAYADRSPDFPQQTTGDQFFDETQWEAYHQLGLQLGMKTTQALIADARAAVAALTQASSSLQKAEAQAKAQEEPKRDRRDRAGFTVRASLGAGLSLSVLLAGWQGVEQFRESRRAEARDYEALSAERNDKIATAPIATLLPEQFSAFAEQSSARGDQRFDRMLDRLNARCESIQDEAEKKKCVGLYAELKSEPKPFYDYWFADKREAWNEHRVAAVSASAAVPTVAATASLPVEPSTAGGGSPKPVEAALPADRPPFLEAIGGAGRPIADRAPASAPESETGADTEPVAPDSGSATAPVIAPDRGACATGSRVFLHIYDETSRAVASAKASLLMKELGFPTAPIENVVETSKQRNRRSPYVWSSPAVVTHQGTDAACVEAVKTRISSDATIRTITAGSKGTLEIWFPPRTEQLD